MEKGGDQSDEDNPFSFKAFLKRGTEDPAEKKKGKKSGTRKKKTQPATDAAAQGKCSIESTHRTSPDMYTSNHCVIH